MSSIPGTCTSGVLSYSPKITPSRVFCICLPKMCWEGTFTCYWLSPLEIHTCSKQGRETMGRRNPHSHQWGKDPVEGRSGNQLGSPGMDRVLANQRQCG